MNIYVNDELFSDFKRLKANNGFCVSRLIRNTLKQIQANNININQYISKAIAAKNNCYIISSVCDDIINKQNNIKPSIYLRAVLYYIIDKYNNYNNNNFMPANVAGFSCKDKRTINLNEGLYKSIRYLFANSCISGAIQAAIQNIKQNNIDINQYLVMALNSKNNNKQITITFDSSLLNNVKINKGVFLRAVCYYLIHLY